MPETSLPSFGRYELLEEVGAGAMGVVYLCVDPRLARPVAIKMMREVPRLGPAEREQYAQRFRNEAEAAGRLNHPGIVQVYDVGPSYIVMEFLEGRTFAGLLQGDSGLTVGEACSIVIQVADAVDYAHRHGIVHRDIKPANIMLMDDGGVKVMDFGVARLPSSDLTMAGTVVGSVRYMAPEQMMGERVDGRADVFSLAAVAYEALTGLAPFPGKTITEVVSRVVQGHHVPPHEADDRLPEGVNGVFDRAFAPRAEDRYELAMDFARDLYEAAAPVLDLPVRVAPPPPEPTAPTTILPAVEDPAYDTRAHGRRVAERLGRAATASASGEGLLALDSDPPGAVVYLDGNPAGTAPVSREVAFGRHVVRMEAEGRDPVSADVDLKPEHPLKVVSFSLPLPDPARDHVRRGQMVVFGPGVTPPRRVAGAPPAYPPAALERGLEGAPMVDLWVSETGDVMDVALVQSAGALLDGALLEAVAAWRFEPATSGGVPVSMRITVQHLFRR